MFMLIVINRKKNTKDKKTIKKVNQKHNERMILQEQIKLYKKLLQSIH